MSDDVVELKQFFTNYMNDVSEQGLPGLVPYYTEPLSVFSPNGVTVLETAEQLIELFTPVLEDMNTQGYSHMEAVEMNAKTLGENLAIVSNVVVRYKKDGSELNRTAGTYLVHKNSQGWKIGSLVMGDADKVIRF